MNAFGKLWLAEVLIKNSSLGDEKLSQIERSLLDLSEPELNELIKYLRANQLEKLNETYDRLTRDYE